MFSAVKKFLSLNFNYQLNATIIFDATRKYIVLYHRERS